MATDKARENSEEVKKNTQETAKETRTIKQTMDELAKTMVSVASTMADVARNSKETAKQSRDFRSEFDQVAKLQKSIEKDTEAVFNLTQKINKGQKLTTREMQRLEKAQSNINRLKTLEEDLQAKLVNALDEERVLIKEILDDIKGTADATGEVTKGINKINAKNRVISLKDNFNLNDLYFIIYCSFYGCHHCAFWLGSVLCYFIING
mgnify:CR=1 FL=1